MLKFLQLKQSAMIVFINKHFKKFQRGILKKIQILLYVGAVLCSFI